MNRFSFTIIFTFTWLAAAVTQDCNITITGKVIDTGTKEPLEYVNIYINESGKGGVSDQDGNFLIKDNCPGEYHLTISHIGCASKEVFLIANRDTSLLFYMDHSATVLPHVEIGETSTNVVTTQKIEIIKNQEITDNANKTIAFLLENIPGVRTLRNGSTMGKPIIHGLFGNRVTIINNGVAQAGQQWGNDHSPEIDPLSANTITVIKGSSALAYLGSNLGSVIVTSPSKIGTEPHLHGRATYFFESNGRSHGANFSMKKYNPILAWKVNGTLKKSGDRKTPNYYLNNTGSQEGNLSLQLEKNIGDKLFLNLYASTFNTSLGVLRGSHIGNLTDLENAFEREVPFFTEEQFSYSIDPPRQAVTHNLIKLTGKYFMSDEEWLEITMAGQHNDRKEYDVRRSGRSEIPALSLKLYNGFLESIYHKSYSNESKVKIGIQTSATDNTNDPETGILPLIPNYRSFQSGIFGIWNRDLGKSTLEAGMRYDFVQQNAVTITMTTPREIVRYNNDYHNISLSGGYSYRFSEKWSASYNLGLVTRNPAINELYSGGLHQGVSGIEEGSPDLQSERSIKSTLSLNTIASSKVQFQALGYYQRIDDFIYLNPQDEVRLTIRGAFPVFRYEQTDAAIYGMDLSSKIQMNNNWQINAQASFIQGDDMTNAVTLINIPSDNIRANLTYQLDKNMKLRSWTVENFEVSGGFEHVFRQADITEEQDFILPPDAYSLLNLKMSTDVQLSHNRLRISLVVDNLLNTNYRDYLDRQRYFADALGRNLTFNVGLKF